jgi:two-component system, sensor histidine kinase and response regulator
MDQPRGANILVVDDTIENLRLLASMLGEHGHEVRPVTGGRLALQAAQSAPPDIVLLDITMPEMDGFEVCERFKHDAALRDVPVIFLTALSDTAAKVRAFAAGGADYITKPFQVEEVLARVDAHVALRRSRAQLQDSFDRLRALEQMREDMTNMIVHDIRSPLGALIMLLDFVQEEAGGKLGDAAGSSLQTAGQAAASINRLVNDLLDVSRMEAGRMPLKPKVADVVDICRDAVALLRSLDTSRGMELLAAGPAQASCDHNLVRRVVENLVGNAVKHTPTSGHIVVAVAQSGADIRVEVRDDGRGVPPEVRDKIFDKYTSLAARAEQKYHSAGLGLTFCKMAVEAHGGRIGVDAAEPHGSVFWFELPARPRS